MDDTQIIELFWKRSEYAITELDHKYSQFCYSIAWNLLSNTEDSEECVNDTWFAVWQAIPPQRPVRLPAFLGKITHGFAVNILRKRYAAKRPDRHIIEVTDELMELNHAVTYDLDENILAEELMNIINHFLDSLSPELRDIFIQRYWRAETIQHIAARHHISEGAVKQKLRRTRKKLYFILQAEGRI